MLTSFTLSTKKRSELIDITHEVSAAIRESGVKTGLAVVHVPHTTAGVTINENADPDVRHDIEVFLAKLIPEHTGFRHGEGNSDAHLKSSFFGPSLTVIVEEGRPLLGTWQGIYFCEFDGPRTRRYFVKIQGD